MLGTSLLSKEEQTLNQKQQGYFASDSYKLNGKNEVMISV